MRSAGQKQTRQKSALSTHSQAMLCNRVHLLLQGRRAPYRWTWVTRGSAWCIRSAAAYCRRSDTAKTGCCLGAGRRAGQPGPGGGRPYAGHWRVGAAAGAGCAAHNRRPYAPRHWLRAWLLRRVCQVIAGMLARAVAPCPWWRPARHQICEGSRAALGHARWRGMRFDF